MKKRIKTPICLNCKFPLRDEDNFCPECGQENDNKRQTFGVFMFDLFENFLSLDSKFAKSLPAILFKPGYLTKEYISGKRQRYLAPARMFITIVVVFFLISSIGSKHNDEKKSDKGNATSTDKLNDNTNKILIQEGPMSFRVINDEGDTLYTDDKDVLLENEDFGKSKYGKIRRLVKSGITDTQEIMDSIHVENTFINRFYFSQAIKLAETKYMDLMSYFRDKLPWILFFLMPVFALILKLVYIRRKFLYIDHLIFAFHLNTFYFLIATLTLITNKISGWDVSAISVLIMLLYSYLSFKRFYEQGFFKTVLKISLITILYAISAFLSILIILLIMFMLY